MTRDAKTKFETDQPGYRMAVPLEVVQLVKAYPHPLLILQYRCRKRATPNDTRRPAVTTPRKYAANDAQHGAGW